MRSKLFGAGLALALIFTACGGGSSDIDPDEAVLQIKSEGGFVPVEFALGSGPRFTLLGDGTLIYQGVTTLEFPGRLVPPYLTARLSTNQMTAVMAMVEDIGLADIDDETDDSATQFVADAATDVITYWDSLGEHRYAVYALGVQEDPSERNAAFLRLVETLDRFTAEATGQPYESDRVRLLANVRADPHGVTDLRPWPSGLEEDLDQWASLGNGWVCTVKSNDVLPLFDDATQVTEWENPDQSRSNPPVQLLVRPLHPGEPDCP